MKHNTLRSKNIIPQERSKVKTQKPEVKLTIHIPDSVSENIRRKKINRIFDLLTADVHE